MTKILRVLLLFSRKQICNNEATADWDMVEYAQVYNLTSILYKIKCAKKIL